MSLARGPTVIVHQLCLFGIHILPDPSHALQGLPLCSLFGVLDTMGGVASVFMALECPSCYGIANMKFHHKVNFAPVWQFFLIVLQSEYRIAL